MDMGAPGREVWGSWALLEPVGGEGRILGAVLYVAQVPRVGLCVVSPAWHGLGEGCGWGELCAGEPCQCRLGQAGPRGARGNVWAGRGSRAGPLRHVLLSVCSCAQRSKPLCRGLAPNGFHNSIMAPVEKCSSLTCSL